MSDQCIVASFFFDLAIPDDDDTVGPADRAEAMRDDQCRPPGCQLFKVLLDHALGLSIDAACRFVQHEYRCVLQQ